MDYPLPYDLLWDIFEYLPDPDRTTFGQIEDDVCYNVFLDIGYQKITVNNKKEAVELVKLIHQGLKLYRTEVVLNNKIREGSYVDDEFVKQLVGVHTIDLEGCTQITDDAIKALAGPNLHTIYLKGCTQLTDDAIQSLGAVYVHR